MKFAYIACTYNTHDKDLAKPKSKAPDGDKLTVFLGSETQNNDQLVVENN